MRHYVNLRAVPFHGPPPRGPVMKLPNTAPIKTPGPPGFIQWLQSESGPHGLFPGVFQHLRSNAPQVVSQAALHAFVLGQDSSDVTATFITPTVEAGVPDAPTADPSLPGGQAGGWADNLANIVAPVVTGIEQIKLFNTQLSLAQQGRPPLNTSQMRLPGIGVNVGVQPSTGLMVGGVVAAVALLALFGGRRRS
jgi:hypothetical protein